MTHTIFPPWQDDGLETDLALACRPDGRLKEYPRLHVGCPPRTCLGTGDKAGSGCSINRHLFSFAAAHLGKVCKVSY
jgi:hypothetical protein